MSSPQQQQQEMVAAHEMLAKQQVSQCTRKTLFKVQASSDFVTTVENGYCDYLGTRIVTISYFCYKVIGPLCVQAET